MLKLFRDELKSFAWVLWVVIIAFVLLVFVDFGGAGPGGAAATGAAVTVNGDQVTIRDFETAYRRTEGIYRQIYRDQYTPELAREIGLAQQVLNGLVDSRLLAAEARQMGVAVTDEEVQEAILTEPSLQDSEGNFIGAENYVDLLRRNGLTPDAFEGQIRDDLLTDKMRTILGESVFVTDQEVEASYRETVEKAKVRFVRLPISNFEDQVEVGAAEVQAYFDGHSEDFRQPERRSVEYLKVDSQALRDEMTIDAADLRAYYQENIDSYTNDEQVRARHILLRVSDERSEEQALAELETARARIAAGGDFAEVAEELSDDPGSAQRGGDLGFFGRGDMVPAFEQAAFDNEPGTLSDPVKTDFGYHLIEVMEKRAGGQQPFEEVEAQIRNVVAAERSREMAEAKGQELATRLSDKPAEDLAAIADSEAGVTRLETAPFGREDAIPGVGRSSAFTVTAFDLVEGAFSEPVRIPGGWAILRQLSVEAPRVPALDEVEPEVRSAVAEQKKRQLAQARLAELKLKLSDDYSLEDVAEELGLEVQESAEFGRNGAIGSLGRSATIAEAALAGVVGDVKGPLSQGTDEVLIEVLERTQFDPAIFAAERESTRARLVTQKSGALMSSLLAERRAKAKLDYNQALMQNFGLLEDAGESS